MLRESLLFLGRSPGARRLLTGTPLTRGMAQRFVPGEGLEDLVRAIREVNALGLSATANYLGEAVRDRPTATAAADMYQRVLGAISEDRLDANISLKFTQMGQEIGADFLQSNLGRVLDRAEHKGLFVRFDMESSAFVERTLSAFEGLWNEGRRGIGVVLQAALHRTPADLERMIERGVRVRLCKGAYAEPEEVALQDPGRIKDAFLRMMRRLLDAGTFPALATHDERIVEGALAHARSAGIGPDRFEFQMLYGVRRDLQRRLAGEGWRVRVYIPFGESWYPYLMRRLAERPANVLFLAGSLVKESPLSFLWPDRPADRATGGTP